MAPKRCEVCGTVNVPTAEICECGRRFDGAPAGEDLDDLRMELTHRNTMGWLSVVGGAAAMLGVTGLLVAMAPSGVMLWMALFGTGVGLVAKGSRTISRTRRRLRAIAPKPLPAARIVSR